jgi:hypothetical protein
VEQNKDGSGGNLETQEAQLNQTGLTLKYEDLEGKITRKITQQLQSTIEDITKKIKTLIKGEIRNEPGMALKPRQSQTDVNEPERRNTSMEEEKEESKTEKTINCGATESRKKIDTVGVPGDQRNTELESEEDLTWREGEQPWSRVTWRRGPRRIQDSRGGSRKGNKRKNKGHKTRGK